MNRAQRSKTLEQFEYLNQLIDEQQEQEIQLDERCIYNREDRSL